MALGTMKPTRRQPIRPADQTMIRTGREEIKKIVEIATIVAINTIMYTRLRVVRPPLAWYSRMYLPKNDCNNHVCKREEER